MELEELKGLLPDDIDDWRLEELLPPDSDDSDDVDDTNVADLDEKVVIKIGCYAHQEGEIRDVITSVLEDYSCEIK
jgi:hypothetical protein